MHRPDTSTTQFKRQVQIEIRHDFKIVNFVYFKQSHFLIIFDIIRATVSLSHSWYVQAGLYPIIEDYLIFIYYNYLGGRRYVLVIIHFPADKEIIVLYMLRHLKTFN